MRPQHQQWVASGRNEWRNARRDVPRAPPRCARHSTRPTPRKGEHGPSGLCDGALPDSLLADVSDRCVALRGSRASSRQADCLCCLVCRLHDFFHFLHCPRVRASPPGVKAELLVLYSAAAERDILAIATRTLYRAPPQLSASPPVETAGDSGGGAGDAGVGEERELLVAERRHGKSPHVGWVMRAVWNRDSKNANFSLSLIIVIFNFKNRYLSLVNYLKSLFIVS